MKKIILISIFAVAAISLFAQEGSVFFGARGGYGSSWLLNPNVMDQGASQDFSITGSHNLSVFAGYNITDGFGLETGLILNTHKQKYVGDYWGAYESLVKMNSVDIPLFFRIGKAVYFEAGPIVSFISDVEYDLEYASINWTYSDNVTDDFKGTNICFSIGVGGDIPINESIAINIGGRIIAGLTDIEGVNALGVSKDLLGNPDDFKTNTAYAGLHLGLKFSL